jgi:site-specific recombinase XerC
MEAWARSKSNDNTKASYRGYAKEYLKWCADRRLPSEDPAVVSAFIRYMLEDRKLSRGTINNTVTSAVADIFRFSKFAPTRDPLVVACKKVVVSMTDASVGKKPLSREQLVQMVGRATPCEKDIRDIFMFILMFGGLLRESEVVGLKKAEVWLVDDEIEGEVLYISINKSKRDQEKRGATVVLAACPGSPLCPVKWFKLYSQVARSTTSFFHSTFATAAKLANSSPNGILKKWLAKLGVSVEEAKLYGSHSLRKGGATAASAKRVRLHLLKRHGRWSSDAVFIYVVDPLVARLEVSRAVLE